MYRLAVMPGAGHVSPDEGIQRDNAFISRPECVYTKSAKKTTFE